jgi:hypothetical protein
VAAVKPGLPDRHGVLKKVIYSLIMKWLFIVLFVFLFSACCQEECMPCNVHVSFEKFKAAEVDTVLFIEYVPGTGQTSVRSTQERHVPTVPGDTAQAVLYKILFCGSDWKIEIPAVNRQYLLTDIETKLQRCPCDPGKQPMLKSYKVNGTVHDEHTLILQ